MFVNRVPSSVSSAVSVRSVKPAVPANAGEAGRPVGLRRGTRRDLVRGLLASAVAVALTPVVAASWPSDPPGPARPGDDVPFDEMYRGRHLLGSRTVGGDRAMAGGDDWQVTVDGRPLHLMRRADGSYLSMVDHYRSYPTALAAARAAVDELGPSEHLRGPDAGESDTKGGSHQHGVHA